MARSGPPCNTTQQNGSAQATEKRLPLVLGLEFQESTVQFLSSARTCIFNRNYTLWAADQFVPCKPTFLTADRQRCITSSRSWYKQCGGEWKEQSPSICKKGCWTENKATTWLILPVVICSSQRLTLITHRQPDSLGGCVFRRDRIPLAEKPLIPERLSHQGQRIHPFIDSLIARSQQAPLGCLNWILAIPAVLQHIQLCSADIVVVDRLTMANKQPRSGL